LEGVGQAGTSLHQQPGRLPDVLGFDAVDVVRAQSPRVED
jgi:hypothetical protein